MVPIKDRLSQAAHGVIIALAAFAAPADLSAAPSDSDPIVGSMARYQAAAAQLADPAAPPEGDDLARIASEAIAAAYFSERFPEAASLFARYRDVGLGRIATVAGLGATLQSSSDAERKAQARRHLGLIGAGKAQDAPLAPALAQAALGADAFLRDDVPSAIEFFRIAESHARRDLSPDDPAQVMFAVQYARHLGLAKPVEGRAASERAEKLALEILPQGHPNWIGVWYDMANREMTANRYDVAQALFARITDLAVREWGDSDPRLFPMLQYQAIALSSLGRVQEGLVLAQAALAVEGAKSAGDRAMHRELIGGLLLGEGRVAEAAQSYREGLALLEGTDPDDLRWGFIQARLARAASLLGEDAEALRLAELAIPAHAAKLSPDHPGRVISEGMIALAQARSGAPAQALALLEAGIAANEARLLDSYARAQDVRAIASRNNTLFRNFSWVALKNNRIEDGWRAAQLATLGELALSTARLSYPGDAEGFGATLEAVRDARRSEAEVRAKVAGGETQADALSAAIARREAAEEELDARYPGHAEFLRPKPMTLAEAQASLADDQAIIVPMSIEDRNVTMLVTSTGAIWAETVSQFNSTAALVARLRTSLENESLGETASGGFDTAAAHELYTRFFPPEIERALKHKTSLVFPSGGILAQIPPAVLMSRLPARTRPGRYLIEDYAITIRSSLRPLARAGRALANGFAGIGAPQLAPPRAARASLRGVTINPKDLRALPSLPGSQAELEAMREAFVGEEALLLTGANATEPKVRAAGLGAYRVLAFSTHGLVGGQMAALPEPALVLTPPEIPSPDDDGLLTASEIAGLELAADWVILSACNTAAGDGRGSATYSGLARAFQLAGARSLLLSHWPVRDDAAAFLAVETLRRAEAGTDRAQALQAAQLALVRGTTGLRLETSPGVWAPFVLID